MTLEISSPIDFANELGKLYEQGLSKGDSSGWVSVDDFYTVAVHYWTVITGIPSHGKSTWMDNLMLNLMKKGWKFIVYTPEQQPYELYIAQLIEKLRRRPFRAGYANRLDTPTITATMDGLESRLRVLRVRDEPGIIAFPNLASILVACQAVIDSEGWHDEKVGIIIDPWNELDHTPIDGMNETQMANYELMLFRHWIRQHNTHGFIVAHPQKPQRDRNGELRKVGLYDINGSAAYYNKCDHGIIVRRTEDSMTEIDVEKCRFRHLGKKGSTLLRFNHGTGTYEDNVTGAGRYGGHDTESDSV